MEGAAPKLKSQVIEKRNEIQFRGVKPKETQNPPDCQKAKGDKGRTRFNHVLKQCEKLLEALGIQCVQAPGEAEAYCAFLNQNGVCMKNEIKPVYCMFMYISCSRSN